MGFRVGEKIVYPNHGVSVVEKIGDPLTHLVRIPEFQAYLERGDFAKYDAIVTGLYPHTHGARILSDPLPAAARTAGPPGGATGAAGRGGGPLDTSALSCAWHSACLRTPRARAG